MLVKNESSHFVFDDQVCEAVVELKRRVVEPLVLALPLKSGRYTVDTDATEL